jgi:hypothetical protein
MESKALVTLILQAKNLASTEVRGLQRELKRATDGADKMDAAMRRGASVAKGALALGLGAAAVGAGELADTQARLQADTGASADAAHAMALAVNEIAGSSRTALPDVAAVMAKVVSGMGLSGDAAKSATAQIVDFARVTGQSGAQAALAVDGIGDAWSLSGEASIGVLGKLLVSQQRYGTVVAESEKALTDLAPALIATNTSLDAAVGLLNLFEVSGLDSASAGAALKKSIADLRPGQSLADLVRQVSAIEDPTRRAQKAIELFGAKGGAGLANALKPGRDSLSAFAVSDTDGLGAVQKAADALDSTFPATIKRMVSEAQASLRGFGDTFGTALMAGASAVSIAQAVGIPLAGGLKAAWAAVALDTSVIAAASASGAAQGAIAGAAAAGGIGAGALSIATAAIVPFAWLGEQLRNAVRPKSGFASAPGFFEMVFGGETYDEWRARMAKEASDAAIAAALVAAGANRAFRQGSAGFRRDGELWGQAAADGISASSAATAAAAGQTVLDAADAVRANAASYASAWRAVLTAKDSTANAADQIIIDKAELARQEKIARAGSVNPATGKKYTAADRAQARQAIRGLQASIAGAQIEVNAATPVGTTAGRTHATGSPTRSSAPSTAIVGGTVININSVYPPTPAQARAIADAVDRELRRRKLTWATTTGAR